MAADNFPSTPRHLHALGFDIKLGQITWEVGVNGTSVSNTSVGAEDTLMPIGDDAFVAMVRSGAVWTLWINGTSYGTLTSDTGAMHWPNLRLGNDLDSTAGEFYWCNTKIAQFGIWSVAWSGGDVANHAAGTDPTLIEWSHIVQYLPLQAAPAVDVTGGTTITPIGAPTLDGTAPTITLSTHAVAPSSTTAITLTGTGTSWVTLSPPTTASAGTVASFAVGGATSETFSFTAPWLRASSRSLTPRRARRTSSRRAW